MAETGLVVLDVKIIAADQALRSRQDRESVAISLPWISMSPAST
jgi:hypothetical protein